MADVYRGLTLAIFFLVSAVAGPAQEVTVAFSPRGDAVSLILREIKSAQKSVDVAMFYLSHQELTDALCALAQNRRVAVRVLTGTWMDKPAHRPILDRLAQNGASVFILPLPGEARMHLKCAVVDGETVIAGTANWSRTAFEQNFEDTLIIRSPALGHRYLTHFNSLFAKATPYDAPTPDKPLVRIKFPHTERYTTSKRGASFQAPRAHKISGIARAEVYFNPGREGIGQLLSQVRSSDQRIDIGMYLLNDPGILQALVAKAREGKSKIRVLFDAGMMAGKLLVQAQALWDAGAEIHYFQKDRDALHLKTAIMDGRFVWTGTANWTTGAMDLNVEDMLFFTAVQNARKSDERGALFPEKSIVGSFAQNRSPPFYEGHGFCCPRSSSQNSA